MNYNKEPLGNLCLKVSSGGTPKSTNAEYYDGGTIPWLNTKEVNFCRIYDTEKKITQLGLDNSAAKIIEPNRVIVAMYGATAARVAINKIELSTNQACCNLKIDPNKADYEYVYYCLLNEYEHLASLANGGAQQNLNSLTIKNFKIPVPDLKIQKRIVRVLSALDQKIELNNQQNETLFELGRQLYIEKFENNQTIDKVELGNFFPVITGKKDANASSENGKYPFFTCSKTISKIDDYVFDASAILLAGNGDFNVKFYRGKFDAYQRTYVLIPNNPEYLGFLYWAISYNLPTITANYRGSVIKFITKGNIESFKVPFADNKYIPAFMKYLERIEKNNQYNKVLAGLRDALLPKLMSGEINLEKVEM